MSSQIRSSRAAASFTLAAILVATAQLPAQARQAAAPTSGIRAELIRDIEILEEKYLGLADAMTGKYDWRPGEGVRSVGEVFTHIAGANLYLPSMAGVQPPEAHRVATMEEAFGRMQEMEKVTDEARVKAMLREAFAHAKHAMAAVPEGQLGDATEVFGEPATKRVALMLTVTHMHEHLGQAIAYARTNGVVPPWSAGGGN